jgi:hypothetical protein
VSEHEAESRFTAMLENMGLLVSRQVRRGAKRIDIVASDGDSAVSIEVKLRDWRRGAAQAYLNGAYFRCSLLAMPAGSTAAIDHDVLEALGVGLVEFGDAGVRMILAPAGTLPPLLLMAEPADAASR